VRAGEEPDFIVWGDSHAVAMAPAIIASANQHGAWGLFIGGGSCPPLRTFETLDTREATQRRCNEANAAVLDYLRGHRVPVVFMVARWPKYALGNEYGAEGVFFDPAEIPSPVPGEDEKLAAALDGTLQELRRLGARPVLVMDVPEPGYEVPHAFAKALLHERTPAIAPSREAVSARQKRAREILTAAARKYGAGFVDPTPALCDDTVCRVELNGTLLYRDSDHLTLTGATSISFIFDALFRDVMNGHTGAVAIPPGGLN
jgi:hypothetical protein